MKDLNQCRQELDVIDAQLVWLFEKRMQVAREVALYKDAHNITQFGNPEPWTGKFPLTAFLRCDFRIKTVA